MGLRTSESGPVNHPALISKPSSNVHHYSPSSMSSFLPLMNVPTFSSIHLFLLLQAGGHHEPRVHQFANSLQRIVSSQQRTLSFSYIGKRLRACRTHGCRPLGEFLHRINQEYIDQGVNTCCVRLWQSHLRCQGCQASGEGDDFSRSFCKDDRPDRLWNVLLRKSAFPVMLINRLLVRD